MTTETVTLWRPTGAKELALVGEAGFRAWPPRLPDQPIFYPVLNEDYATRIARDWNVSNSGVGYVMRFEVAKAFMVCYEVHQVGGRTILEYWIPAEDLDELNANILGTIEVVAEYRGRVPGRVVGASMNDAIRVLLADDQRVVREGLGSLLALLGGVEVVGTAADGEDGLALVIE